MAISLPDARQLSDEVLQSLRLRALRGCELGYSESRWRNCLASPERPSRGGGPPTLIMAWKLSQATAPAARSAPVVPSTTGKRHGCGRSSTKKAPKEAGDRLPVVDPQGRRRVDPHWTVSTLCSMLLMADELQRTTERTSTMLLATRKRFRRLLLASTLTLLGAS